MKTAVKTAFFAIASMIMVSCYEEDPGPQQDEEKSFPVLDFDRLEISDAIDVTVRQGSTFSVTAKGDRRNLDDLQIYKSGSTMVARFDDHHNRQYTTYLTITMPVLHGVDFSGAVHGNIQGFEETAQLDLSLSGASMAQLNAKADNLSIDLTGASELRLSGSGSVMVATVSGASLLSAFDFPITEAHLLVTGASHAQIQASQKLKVSASGASGVLYRGSPLLETDVTGASSVAKD